jgi:hypothetical protein
VAVFGRGGDDALLEGAPAAHPVLTGDGQLGVVQGGELSRGQPPLRFELKPVSLKLCPRTQAADTAASHHRPLRRHGQY